MENLKKLNRTQDGTSVIHSSHPRGKTTEKGQAILIIALSIIVLMGFAALAIDGARLYSERRAAQNAADAAVLSAALTKCTNGNIVSAAQQIAASNGYNNDGVKNIVVVNNPPLSGTYSGNTKYIEVIITTKVDPGFAVFFHPDPFELVGRAVSHCNINTSGGTTAGTPYGNAIVTTSPHECSAMLLGGNGDITVTNGGVFVNSDCTGGNPAVKLGGNGDLIANPINVVGGVKTGGNGTLSQAPTKVSPITTYWDVPVPDKPSGTCTSFKAGKSAVTINPGLYCGIDLSSDGDVTLNPGIYYIQSGGFKMSGNGSLTAHNVLIYIAPGGGDFSITANGSMDITAPTSGPYKGLAIYANDGKKNLVDMSGNGNMLATGTIYAPNSRVKITGNGSNTTLTAQIVSDTIEVGGNGNITINYDGSQFYVPPSAIGQISLDE